MPLSTLGNSRASGLKKTLNVAGLYLMETEDADQFNEARGSIIGITTDQGAEAKAIDEGVNIIPSYRDQYASDDPKSFLWTRALLVVGHLHLLFNGLEEACKSLGEAHWFSIYCILSVLSWHQFSCDVNSK